MDFNMLAELLFPKIDKNIEDYNKMYPKRKLKPSQVVTRFAPSPTGFVHIGSLYSAFVSKIYAHQSDGVLFLRIEDTDKKREIEDGIKGIVNDMEDFSIIFDEGATYGGNYGPYIQSERIDIYKSFAKHLIKNGMAYPCFCSEEEINDIRKIQELNKDRIGYYGKWAACRNLTLNQIQQKLKKSKDFIIRLKSPGDFNKKIIHNDLIKGRVEFPENDMDIVILKNDGLPTYHFAHLVDDYLMGTTHVIRGDEWLSSVPLHLQLFQVFGFEPLNYAHLSPILKDENGIKRKLSKRKDPEAAVSYYHEKGIPQQAVKIYLATLTNSNFEEWYDLNFGCEIEEFEFKFEKMNVSGAIFDLAKLYNISKIFISSMTGKELYSCVLKYYEEYDEKFAEILRKHKEYSINILDIERYISKPRKDISSYQDVKKEIWYMYDEIYNVMNEDDLYECVDVDFNYDLEILIKYVNNSFDEADDKEIWFAKIKELAIENGYSKDTKSYKKNPDAYKGHVGTICELVRLAITSRIRTPDLYEVSKLIGNKRMKERILKFVKYIKEKNEH